MPNPKTGAVPKLGLCERDGDVIPMLAHALPGKALGQLRGGARRVVVGETGLSGEPTEQRLGRAKAGTQLAQV